MSTMVVEERVDRLQDIYVHVNFEHWTRDGPALMVLDGKHWRLGQILFSIDAVSRCTRRCGASAMEFVE